MAWQSIVIPLFVIPMLIAFIMRDIRTGDLPRRWVQENGYRMLSIERRRLLKGPFFFRAGKHDRVYRLSVEQSDGSIREGYFRCRASLFGLSDDVTEIQWDPERVDERQRGFEVIPLESHAG